MPVVDIFSKRQKRLQGELPDVYQYETIPQALRNQVLYIWDDTFGSDKSLPAIRRVFEYISNVLRREYGLATLGGSGSPFQSVRNFFLSTKVTEQVLDVIEISFQRIDEDVRSGRARFPYGKMTPDEAIDELNHRFREHGVGYQYESGLIIRVDSEFIHSEVVKPALEMLSDPMYEGANAEFLKAHEHYRTQRYEECMNECLKAFESCIKAICIKRQWTYNDGDTISHLIDIVFDKELIPAFMESHFTGLRKALDVRKGLRSALESGVPPLRNNCSGHGQGREEVTVPEYMAAYTLHLTASNILFLAKANEEIK